MNCRKSTESNEGNKACASEAGLNVGESLTRRVGLFATEHELNSVDVRRGWMLREWNRRAVTKVLRPLCLTDDCGLESGPMNESGEPNMGNPSVRFDEGRERDGHRPLAFQSHPLLPILQADPLRSLSCLLSKTPGHSRGTQSRSGFRLVITAAFNCSPGRNSLRPGAAPKGSSPSSLLNNVPFAA
jgi:hypothetical protein